MKKGCVTLWELVEAIQDTAGSDAEVIAILNHLVTTGRVTLPAAIVGQRGCAAGLD